MVEYAILLAHNSAEFMGGLGGNIAGWVSHPNWALVAYAAGALVLVRLAYVAFGPNRRY